MGVVVDVAIIWIAYNIRAAWREARKRCFCSHEVRHHVSAWDWDSDYGDPQHVGPDYKKPGTCRKCKCIQYHEFVRAA